MLPRCTQHHLLVPRQPLLVAWRATLLGLTDETFSFSFKPPSESVQHIFTDGSCTTHSHPQLRLAAWSVVSATERDVIATGHLHGVVQSIDRAELAAALCAVRWGNYFGVTLFLWIDSLSTVNMATYVINHHSVPTQWANQDLWQQFCLAVLDRSGLDIFVRWIPSHLSKLDTLDAFEDWAVHWNDEADRLAIQANADRANDFQTKFRRVEQLLDWWTERISQLRQFFFSVAADLDPDTQVETTPLGCSAPQLLDDDDVIDLTDEYVERAELLPVNWRHTCLQQTGTVPGSFLVLLLDWICAMEALGDHVKTVSCAELICILVQDSQFQFPFQTSGTNHWELRTLDSLFAKPAFVSLLRPVQNALRIYQQMFPDVEFVAPSQTWPDLGLYMRFEGIRLRLPTSMADQARQLLLHFTGSRSVRRTNDLARPLR